MVFSKYKFNIIMTSFIFSAIPQNSRNCVIKNKFGLFSNAVTETNNCFFNVIKQTVKMVEILLVCFSRQSPWMGRKITS